MPKRKSTVQLPSGASTELKVTERLKGKIEKASWSEAAEACADKLAQSQWHSCTSRPKQDTHLGYFVVLRWYAKEGAWVPLYLQHGNIARQLTHMFNGKELSPIGKYVSSFPRDQRKLLWIKWVHDSQLEQAQKCEVTDVLRAFSTKYNQGELLPFNEETETIPDNFSLLNYR